jgi:hypothetical protein
MTTQNCELKIACQCSGTMLQQTGLQNCPEQHRSTTTRILQSLSKELTRLQRPLTVVAKPVAKSEAINRAGKCEFGNRRSSVGLDSVAILWTIA